MEKILTPPIIIDSFHPEGELFLTTFIMSLPWFAKKKI